jgi:hypothetical protein
MPCITDVTSCIYIARPQLIIIPWVITSRLMNTVSIARASSLSCARHDGVVANIVSVARASPLPCARHDDVVIVFVARFPISVARLYGLVLRLSAMSSVPHTDVANTWLNVQCSTH